MSNIPKYFRILFVPAELIVRHNQLSARTLARCQRALQLWRTGKYNYIVVSGGLFLPRTVQTEPAGVLMSRWFNERGVEPDRIIIEDRSLDTFENISGAVSAFMDISELKDPDKWAVTVVTHWQHAKRFVLTFRKAYDLEIKVAPVDYSIGLIAGSFEWLFIFIHYIDPAGTGPIARLNRWWRRRIANR